MKLLRLQGALSLDEAADFGKCMSNTRADTCVFAMFPLVHQSTDRAAVVKSRRDIEDKLTVCFVCI